MQELLDLALHQAADRDAGPGGHHLGDVLLVDLLLEHAAAPPAARPARRWPPRAPARAPAASRMRRRAAPSRSSSRWARSSSWRGGLDLLLDLADAGDHRLLQLPVGPHGVGLLAQRRQLLGDRVAAGRRARVGLGLERLLLDLELHDAPLHDVELGGHGVDLDAQAAGRLVDQVDRLVRQEARGDVAVRQPGGGHQGPVLDAHAVVHLVALLQAAQDRDGRLDRRLADHHRLEAALQRGVLLDVLAVLVERRRAHRPQLAAGQHRLQQVRGVHGPLGGARADDRVQLVDEEDHPAGGVLDLPQHRLEAVLELAAVLGAREQRADVQGHDALAGQPLGDVAGHDALGEALDDRGLAGAGLADQHGVVLGAPRQDLDDAPDLLVAADHRVELPALGQLGEVAAVLLERLVLVLGVRVGHARGAAHRLQRAQQAVAGDAVAPAAPRGPARTPRAAPAEGARSRCTGRRGARPPGRRGAGPPGRRSRAGRRRPRR